MLCTFDKWDVIVSYLLLTLTSLSNAQVPLSECLSVFQWSGCGRVCPPSLEPVCGSDDKTYLNTCFMEQESCRARSLGGVSRKHYGPCGHQQWKKGARNYMYRK